MSNFYPKLEFHEHPEKPTVFKRFWSNEPTKNHSKSEKKRSTNRLVSGIDIGRRFGYFLPLFGIPKSTPGRPLATLGCPQILKFLGTLVICFPSGLPEAPQDQI